MLDLGDILVRVGCAALIGAMIGLNRHLRHHDVGLRTLALIAAGAAALVIPTLNGIDGTTHVDALSRVVQGILTGLGFIGAGVIVRGPTEKKVHGLTTAASVWTTAVLGVLCGCGAWRIAGALGFATALILILGGPFERWAHATFDRLTGADRPPT